MPTIKTNIANFLKLVPYILQNKTYNGRPIPVMIRGRHGIGKSEIVHQLGKNLELHVENIRAGEMTEGDFVGIPEAADSKITENRITNFLAPTFIDRACAEPTILFLDEINRGTPEVQQGMFKLADSGQVGNHVLHPNTMIISAVNPAGGDYQVAELDPAANDRWFVIDLEPTLPEWVSWAKESKIHDIIISYIEDHPDSLDPPDTFEVGEVYPSRRSWARFSKVLSSAEIGMGEGELSQEIVKILAAGFVGERDMVTFAKYYASHAKENAFKRFFEKGKFGNVKEISMEDSIEAFEVLKERKIFNKKLTDKMASNVVEFSKRIPIESFNDLIIEHINPGLSENTEILFKMPLNDGTSRTFGQYVHEATISND